MKKETVSSVTLELCVGSNEGKAMYLCFDNGGTRIAGGKCWGYVNTLKSWKLRESDLDDIIIASKEAKRWLKKQNKKLEKNNE